MPLYYVSKLALENTAHEVHEASCRYLPGEDNRHFLGDLDGCQPAMEEARKHYRSVNGCFHCADECHTR